MKGQDEGALPFREVEHGADVALWVRGGTLRELFVNAAVGMTRMIAEDALPELPCGVSSVSPVSIEVSLDAPDVETLLVDWLGELAALAGDDGLLFVRFEIREIGETRLDATITGGRADHMGIHIVHVKAVTFHNLEIRRTEEGFETTIVFDV